MRIARPRRAVTAVAVVLAGGAGAGGVLTANAEERERLRPSVRPARPLPARPPVLPAPGPCRPRAKAPATPPSAALLRTFGVLRRERAADDALPADALRALRRRGLNPVEPASARLLRTGPGAGRAWIVPVPDARAGFGPFLLCRGLVEPPVPRMLPPRAVPPRLVPPRPAPLPRIAPPRAVPRPERFTPRLPRVPRDLPRRFVAPPAVPRAVPVPPFAPAPLEVPVPARPWPGRFSNKPQEGVAVVAIGGAAVGGGGALADLVRGRAPVSVEPCAGPRRDMVGVSGIVPDGVERAYLTSEDGTAVRADVADNAYAFVVPRDRRPQQRYVVWSGPDGTPHVQPVFVPFIRRATRCPRLPARIAGLPRVSPGDFSQFMRPFMP